MKLTADITIAGAMCIISSLLFGVTYAAVFGGEQRMKALHFPNRPGITVYSVSIADSCIGHLKIETRQRPHMAISMEGLIQPEFRGKNNSMNVKASVQTDASGSISHFSASLSSDTQNIRIEAKPQSDRIQATIEGSDRKESYSERVFLPGPITLRLHTPKILQVKLPDQGVFHSGIIEYVSQQIPHLFTLDLVEGEEIPENCKEAIRQSDNSRRVQYLENLPHTNPLGERLQS